MEKKNIYIRFANGYNPIQCFYNLQNTDMEGGVEECLKHEIEKAGFDLKFTFDASNLENFAGLISWEVDQRTLSNLTQYPRNQCFLLIFEPPCSRIEYYDQKLERYFGKIFTIFESQTANPNYVKFHWPVQPFRLKKIDNLPHFSEKKLCAMINSNNYSPFPGSTFGSRRRTLSFFAGTGEFDLYGRGWNGVPCWKGTVENKQNTLKNYKFVICYENSTDGAGYLTEKIFDAFASHCVPVYLGAPNITDYIPKSCFVDRRDFSSEEELYHFMKNMSLETHEYYLSSAQKFLQSSDFEKFTPKYYAKTIIHHLIHAQEG